ncbi:MAG TPA: ribosome biogenesis GTP-binding protein YihA/YsxC [Rhizomicrobium sp.]|nr:ribosome biogenesis GTP-binding protein YihA/YsxC [Rhizomicrobium sp.]
MSGDTEAARKLFTGPCEFIAGAASLDALPERRLPEVAFVGRSNVGKSSLINALTGRGNLARVSNTPGRTRQINLFALRDRLMLADLPGYGFAKISKAEARSWNDLILGYLHTRKMLRRIVLLIDARRGVMESDEAAMSLLDRAAVPVQTVLTKADKLKADELAGVKDNVAGALTAHPVVLSNVMATSAESGAGIPELRALLAELADHG